MTLIDSSLLDSLSAGAAASERLRMMTDMRNTPDDGSQRAINALEPGTVVPVHRHRGTSESCVVLRGRLRSTFYNDRGEVTAEYIIAPTEGTYMVQVPAGQWHTAEALEPGTVIFEAKDGHYEPLSQSDILSI